MVFNQPAENSLNSLTAFFPDLKVFEGYCVFVLSHLSSHIIVSWLGFTTLRVDDRRMFIGFHGRWVTSNRVTIRGVSSKAVGSVSTRDVQ